MDSPRSAPVPPDRDRGSASESVEVSVSSSPKFWPFVGVGAFIGVLAAMFTALAGDPGAEFTRGSVFGFFAVVFALAGVLLGSIAFLAVDAVLRRRSTRARAVPMDDGNASK
ncbi:MAG: hypothetical protein ACTHWW_04940 [Arthrobacter sp.]|uniref:hypothetical protein n=1 Tax=unclassified Arthrobacter TaxID=235627 RepID=UPI00265309A1|nr:hypothetical protein [Micrococcaceae bacterium]MDN5812194.1 hypothetical protein [Micrococcaceae bacterium]MDN5823272.1 hypothetical protein [Micrococcaceae bacterium]MDN5879128.1 hypothetical protein [Micrococcaceae bacterium]MDN5886816.1 hypothetical protein [Micrococcaceae bacterium]